MAYCTVQDIRDEGITTQQADDPRVTMLIALAGQYIDLITRRWFEPRTLTMKIDGQGHDTMWFPVPIINITAVNVEGSSVPLSELLIYNRRFPDDRNHPKVLRKDSTFPKGSQNVEIAGSFGYTDEGSVTPSLIKQAAKMIVIREIPKLGDLEGKEDKRRARIISETTDRHSYTLSQLASNGEWTGDPDIDNILYFYRTPPGVSVI